VLERALLLSPCPSGETQQRNSLLAAVLPELFAGAQPSEEPDGLRHVGKATEVAHVRRVVDECNVDLEEAAKRLAVSRSTVWRRLRTSGL
jgi:transcriptional regulator, propionate catabolism operon regulatory protein